MPTAQTKLAGIAGWIQLRLELNPPGMRVRFCVAGDSALKHSCQEAFGMVFMHMFDATLSQH